MKKLNVLTAITIAFVMMSCSQGGSGKVVLKNALDSASYALGVNTGGSYESSTFPGEELDVDLISAGFAQAIKGQEVKMSIEEATEFLNVYFTKASVEASQANKQEGEEFLAKNMFKEGVSTTATGLQYTVITEGTGAKPEATDQVTVHYTGKLLDGTVFDSSVERGEPATFGLNQVIPGWSEAVQLMNVGSKYKVWIPSDLAYGESGTGPIPPNSVLEFEIELIEIVK